MSIIKIEQEIVSQRVVNNEPDVLTTDSVKSSVGEVPVRPDMLTGKTYKLKSPTAVAATYVTINDITIDNPDGTTTTRPYEIFIESKDNGHYQWVKALTRIISGFFRTGLPYEFIATELKAVSDLDGGGYIKKGIGYVPSLTADIGLVIERHVNAYTGSEDDTTNEDIEYPDEAVVCPTCSTKALVNVSGCNTCLSCGYSSCG